MKNKKLELWILIAILVGAFVVRLYRLNNPIADWHSWRQADTSAVSRNFVKHGYDILLPRYDDLSNVQTGYDNLNGYRLVEFPIYNVAQAGLFQIFGSFTLEEWGRLITIIVATLSTWLLYLIVKRHSNGTIGLLAAFFFAFTPYNIYYGRTILPDPSMVGAILAGIYFFDRWIEDFQGLSSHTNKHRSWSSQDDKKNVIPASLEAERSGKAGIQERSDSRTVSWAYLILAIVFTAISCLLKPYALFFTLPMIYLAWQAFGFSMFKKWELYIFLILSVIPLGLWRWWIGHYPEGIPASAWLFNGNGIRFRPSFFYWMGYARFAKLISGFGGVGLFLFGLLGIKKIKEFWFFATFLISSILYVCTFATGNVQHDYYQILIIPSLSIFYAMGSYLLIRGIKPWISPLVGKTIFVIFTVIMLGYGWYQVKDYFNINNWPIVYAGQEADKILPKNAKVIAPYNGDTSFLYQTNRQGWPVFEKSPQDLKKMGAEYMVLPSPTANDVNGFGKEFKIVASSSAYLILKL